MAGERQFVRVGRSPSLLVELFLPFFNTSSLFRNSPKAGCERKVVGWLLDVRYVSEFSLHRHLEILLLEHVNDFSHHGYSQLARRARDLR